MKSPPKTPAQLLWHYVVTIISFILIVGFPIAVALMLMWATDTGFFAEPTPTPIVTMTPEAP